MRFGEAIDQVTKYPNRVMRRRCFAESDPNYHVGFCLPSGKSDMTGAYFYAKFTNGDIDVKIPWFPDVFDMTANDWETYDHKETD